MQYYQESHPENREASYKVCVITGIILLCFYYYFTFWATEATNYADDGTGIISILVCLSPAASGVIMLFDKDLVFYEQVIIIVILIIHLLSMISVVIHFVKKIYVPKSTLVLISRIWSFVSIGLAVLVVIIVKFPDFINRKTNSR